MVITQVCQGQGLSGGSQNASNFQQRLQVCKDQGRQLRILPQKLTPREDAYCQCRIFVFNGLKLMSRWCLVVWVAELIGVCLVIYFGMEPLFARMESTQKRDVLAFAVIGLAVLVG